MIRLMWAALVLSAPAVAKPPGALKPSGEVVARAGEHEVTEDMVKAVVRLTDASMSLEDLEPVQYRALVQRIGVSQILYEQALDEGLHKDPDVQVAIALAVREVLATQILTRASREAVTDEQVASFYEQNADRYDKPRARARHILTATEEDAQAVYERLQAGEDFTEVATQVSLDPGSKANGGDLGWFGKEEMVTPFANAVFGVPAGSLLQPLQTRFGWHVIEVLERADTVPLDDVRGDIEAELANTAVGTMLEQLQSQVVLLEDEAEDGDAEAAP